MLRKNENKKYRKSVFMNYRKIENQKFSMKKIVLAVMGMFALSAGAYAQENAEARNDSVKVRYIYTMQAQLITVCLALTVTMSSLSMRM